MWWRSKLVGDVCCCWLVLHSNPPATSCVCRVAVGLGPVRSLVGTWEELATVVWCCARGRSAPPPPPPSLPPAAGVAGELTAVSLKIPLTGVFARDASWCCSVWLWMNDCEWVVGVVPPAKGSAISAAFDDGNGAGSAARARGLPTPASSAVVMRAVCGGIPPLSVTIAWTNAAVGGHTFTRGKKGRGAEVRGSAYWQGFVKTIC